jgi:hypothetical protein
MRRPTDQTEDRWSIIGVGTLTFTFIGAPARRVGYVTMWLTFFPAF